MSHKEISPVISKVMIEENQGHETRKPIFEALEKELKRPVVTLFTSFKYPVMIEDTDADMLEGILQKINLENGLALVINSPGGDGLAAERIVNVCRCYSNTGEYWSVVPGKAKSAATMICFGSSKIIMGATSELGPIDPQLTIGQSNLKRFSAYNIVKSYEGLFNRAVEEQGNLEPYLQQLSNYDEREIEELRASLSLSEDIAVRTLASGMMKNKTKIKNRIKIFLTPETTKTHGRPIYRDEAAKSGLNINKEAVRGKLWTLIYELYIRTDNFVSGNASKCIESKDTSFYVSAKGG